MIENGRTRKRSAVLERNILEGGLDAIEDRETRVESEEGGGEHLVKSKIRFYCKGNIVCIVSRDGGL